MNATLKPLSEMTAEDLMSGDLVLLPENLPLREAARRLLHNQIGGAPVVDAEGRCVGVLSSIDFLRLAEHRAEITKPAAPPLPITCSFQVKHRTADGRDVILCTLASGACPLQVKDCEISKERMVCSQPNTVLVDWQAVEVEKLPADEVRQYMTPDPVTVTTDTPIRVLARMMIDAHIHRIVVVDDERRPVGIVSSTNLLTALADDHNG